MNHHYPRKRTDRELTDARNGQMPSLDDLASTVCGDCGRDVGHALRGSTRVCEHCDAPIGQPAPGPAQIAVAAVRLREHSRWLMANRSRKAGPGDEEDDELEVDDPITSG